MLKQDTIVAQATAPGRGGVGIVRISGPEAKDVADKLVGKPLKPRMATYVPFKDETGQTVDQGLALFFEGPNSFTGEDVLELQGHGGHIVMDILIRAALSVKNVRQAEPGEFSERAFMNNKMDLVQAEAIADLIEATSEQAAKNALQSMQGAFSKEVSALVESLTHLRMYVEAAIDFPEEEIDFLSDGKVQGDLYAIEKHLHEVFEKANQGAMIREGMNVVIAGRPNAGKSSLLNELAGKESAIVTNIAGTTRDVLREHIHLDGMPVHVIDTAGLRDTSNEVEQIGIERAWKEIQQADRVLFLVDATTTEATDPKEIWPDFMDRLPKHLPVSVIRNKVDLSKESVVHDLEAKQPVIRVSVTENQGLDVLKQHLKDCMGYQGTTESQFSARRRHVDALVQAQEAVLRGKEQLEIYQAGELLAEELRLAQEALSQITGEFSSDDLLGKIFGSFCIGK